jgi:hypothetical protein
LQRRIMMPATTCAPAHHRRSVDLGDRAGAALLHKPHERGAVVVIEHGFVRENGTQTRRGLRDRDGSHVVASNASRRYRFRARGSDVRVMMRIAAPLPCFIHARSILSVDAEPNGKASIIFRRAPADRAAHPGGCA